jgi:eukaryotic-like serine/threonine-protein kinase
MWQGGGPATANAHSQVDSSRTLVQAPRGRERPAEDVPRQRIMQSEDGPREQELVLGRYRTLEQLGSGGFGVVWRARDELLHREVALKRVWLGMDGDSERASREAHAAARLSHPAIVALHEASVEGGAFYLISELVDGDTLARLIDEDALADEEILEVGVALACALAHAHARGVIHRDIKPQNVLVPHPPSDGAHQLQGLLAAAKLTDFGGASLVGEDALTHTGDVLGTLAYMAPEQSEGREVGVQADLYSLALVIYEALCGVNPVRGSTPAATARRIGRPLPPLAAARRDLPAALTAALDRALAPDPRDRGTVDDLRLAFEDTLARGLRRGRWRLPTALTRRDALERERDPIARDPTPRAPRQPAPRQPTVRPQDPPAHQLAPEVRRDTHEDERGVSLPRTLWLALALALVCWQAIVGRAGVALLLLAAFAPLALMPRRRGGSHLGFGWIACALAPALGLAGLAGAFPALAGQASRWRERAALGALAYWWLALAGPLLARDLWLRSPASPLARGAWEGSLSAAAQHVIGPLLTLGVLCGALLWALAALALPLLVRGRSVVRDALAVSAWSLMLVLATPVLDAGLQPHAVHQLPRGAVFGAILGALLALAARAVRGPV